MVPAVHLIVHSVLPFCDAVGNVNGVLALRGSTDHTSALVHL